jgi:branched-chain amino acid aminotransferase
MSSMIQARPNAAGPSPAERRMRLADLSFGTAFTDHMVSMRWSTADGWHDGELVPYGDVTMPPTAVGLHYGQIVFEGLKAFRLADGRVASFRAVQHARRFAASARRLMMPEMPEDLFVAAVRDLVRQDQDWLGDDPGISLYLRPILFATEETLALRPATEYRFLLTAFVTEGYFGRRLEPVTVWLCEDYVRAAPGGTGAAKCAGNYAAGLIAQEQAAAHGCDQVVWLDAATRTQVEEMGGMNLWFVVRDGDSHRLITPPLTGSILPGVTRDCLLTLAPRLGLPVTEEPVSVEQWRAGCRSGEITEVFACGTAARVSPIAEVRGAEGTWTCGTENRPVTDLLGRHLFAIQRGEGPDRDGWLDVVD